MTPIVYGRPGCQACRLTIKAFIARGMRPDAMVIDEHPEIAIDMRHRGLKELPYVIYGKQTWTGYRPDIIAKLKKR